MSFEIITDTTCDIGIDLLLANNIKAVPLGLTIGGKFYNHMPDYSELPLDEFYKMIRSGEMATTSAVNIGDWYEKMESCIDECREFLLVPLSSALSSTCQSAISAAEELKEKYEDSKVIVIDSKTASAGEGIMALEAARLRDEGKSIEETAEILKEFGKTVAHWFTVDDLHHLKRGGRISAATAFVGTALGLKPLLHVDDEGALVSVDKARGRKKALAFLLDKVKSDAVAHESTIFVAHADCIDDAEALAKEIRAALPGRNVQTTYCGPVIGGHTGANMIGIFFAAKQR